MLGNHCTETLNDGNVVPFLCTGFFQAHVYCGDHRYTFKTPDLAVARKAAQLFALEVEFRCEQQLPLQKSRVSQAIAKHVALREQHSGIQSGIPR
jgi:hypothetical protein